MRAPVVPSVEPCCNQQPQVLSLCSESNLADHVISGFADRAIRYEARQLAGRHGFSLSEREDLEQEFRLHVLRRLASFDPHVAHWNVFVRTLLERHAATLVEQRRTHAHAVVDHEAAAGRVRVVVAVVLGIAVGGPGLPVPLRRYSPFRWMVRTASS